MNNKGFTLVELLAVIVVLAIIVSIAVPSTVSISRKIKGNLFCQKVNLLVNAASLYGEDYKETFGSKNYHINSKTCVDSKTGQDYQVEGGNFNAQEITVSDLLSKGYVKKEKTEDGDVIDPRTNENMEQDKLIVYEKYGRIYVHFGELNGHESARAKDANQCIMTSECH